MTLEYENLVFEGGGILGIAYLGALKEIYSDGSIKQAKRFAGSSAGSIIALLLAIKTDYDKLEKIITTFDFNSLKDDTWIVPDIVRVLRKYGFYIGDKMLSTIRNILADNADITFKQLYEKFGSTLVITGTNISRGKTDYFSKDKYPNMSVALACRISCSIPFFFQAVVFQGDYYVDGGVLNNYPLDCFDATSSKTLGFKLVTDDDTNEEKGIMLPVINIKNFSENLIKALQNQALKIHIKPIDWKRTVVIKTGNINFINFNLTDQQKIFLITQGLLGIQDYKKKII